MAATVAMAARDPVPYAPIAIPGKDSGISQRVRDSLTMRIRRVRVNQAGYRSMDVQLGMAKFYYVGIGSVFTVIDTASRLPVGTGALSSKGFNSGSKIAVRASRWAGTVSGGDTAYLMSSGQMGTSIPSSPVMEGTLPITGLSEGHYYRVVVGKDTSVPFLVSDNIYSYVRDDVLKFFGINRSGDGPSWFHAPSHLMDGFLAKPSNPGAYKGGWYDCGDHLKEPQTMGYALATLATVVATLPTHDADHYGNDQNNTIRTDGVPDILNEAHFGAQFFLKSWKLNGNRTGPAKAGDTGMITGVGDFGKDHGWWGRPETQDAMTENGRGGPKERILRPELGANVLGDVAAALAVLSKRWRMYDPKWADTALIAAKDMYAWAKAHPIVVSSPAYNGAGADKVNANLALAATALLWATKDKAYLNDIAYDKTLGSHGATWNSGAGVQPMKNSWEGGWMVMSNPNLLKGGANTDWANRHAIALYAFYKLILADKDSALAFGVKSEAERQNLIFHTMSGVIGNLDAISGQKTDLQIPLPTLDPNDGGGHAIRTGSDWYVMHIQQEWVWNRYQMGNTTELFFYYDIAKDLEAGLGGTDLTKYDWKRSEVRQLMIRQLDYQLGMNPWDVSMLMGVGNKNFNHPHHRAANPEGRNTPGSSYGYHVPAGALYGGFNPLNTDSVYDFWNDYTHTEVCLDGAAASLSAVVGLTMDVPLNIPPNPTVKVVYVSDTLAQIQVDIDKYGSVKLDLGTLKGVYTRVVKNDSVGVTFVYRVGGLKPGTQYFFDVVSTDLQGNSLTSDHWTNPAPDGTPYSFTTRSVSQGKAQIENVKVCNVTADSAEVMWYTPNGEYQSSICYGRSPVEDTTWRCAQDADISGHPVKFHYVKIGNLQEKTDYWFKVGSDGTWDDNKGAFYRFRTPVKMANFSVYAVQYDWSGMPALAINVVNNEPRPYDSLSVRVYVRSADTLKDANGKVLTHIKSTATGLVNVPMMFDESMAARYDICQAYSPAGFNKPCDDPYWKTVWSWGTLNRGVQMLPPTKMPETCTASDNTCVFYFDLPLGPTMMQQGSRIRFDVIFAARSEYSKNLNQSQLDLINWVKAFVPSVPTYNVGDTGWYDALSTPMTTHPMGNNTQDWSFMPHSVAGGDPVDFVGIPKVANQTAANALIDNLSDDVPLNPYMTVYRKGEFVYGFSPSKIEQSQKKTSWGVNVELKSPFNLPNGSTITLDQSTSTVHVKGSADVFDRLTPAAKGVVTDIWVNGARLSDAQRAAAAVWNPATKLWDLDIPVKMGVGGNNVDVTIFGGGGQCPDTATTCTGGCAFYDAEFFVQFSKGPSTKSVLSLLAPDGSGYPIKTAPDSLAIKIRIADKDQSKKTSIDAVVVTVSNPLRGFSKSFTLTEIGMDTGVFLSASLSPTAKTGALSASEIPFVRGDTLWFSYRDVNDSDDTSIAFVYSEATWPLPVRAGLFRDCSGALKIRALFDKPFTASVGWSDAKVVVTNAAGDSVGAVAIPAAQIAKGTGNELVASVPSGSFGLLQNARLTLPVADGRGGWVPTNVTVSDSIGPWIDSAKIVENVLGTPQDTAYLWTSEKVRGLSSTSFLLSRSGSSSPLTGVDSVRATDNSGRAWALFLQRGTLQAGDSLRLSSVSSVRDPNGNAPADCPSMGRVVSLIGRPAPFAKAWIEDSDGDGQADLVKIAYRKIVGVSDLPDSVEVVFGDLAAVRVAAVSAPLASDSILVVRLPQPFSWGQTKGLAADGSGTIALWKSGSLGPTASLSDSVGPVLISASLRFARAGIQDTLALTFSEPVGPGAGAGWLVHQAGVDLGAAVPVSTTANVWMLPIPVGSVVASDSVKPLPAHRWVDMSSGRHVPAGHRWVAVVGGERAPFQGWYTDEDGDGAVDHVRIHFANIGPKTRPGFSIALPGVSLIHIDTGTWSLDADGVDASVAIGPLAKGVTTFGSSAVGTWNSMGIETTFPIYDSAAPVLVSAVLRYAEQEGIPDTLRVRWSEPLLWTGSNPLVFHRVQQIPVGVSGSTTLDLDGLGASVLVWADSAGFCRGDSARLSPASAGTVKDMFGNAAEQPGVWVPIRIGARPIRLEFAIKNFLEIPEGMAFPAGPSLAVQVRARPEKGASDTSWQRLDGFQPASEQGIVHLTFTVNRPMGGSVHFFDNAGTFVGAVNLDQVLPLSQTGRLPMDGSGMFQVRVAWDGRDVLGKPVSSGVYYARLVLKDEGGDEGEPARLLNRVYTFGIKRMR